MKIVTVIGARPQFKGVKQFSKGSHKREGGKSWFTQASTTTSAMSEDVFINLGIERPRYS